MPMFQPRSLRAGLFFHALLHGSSGNATGKKDTTKQKGKTMAQVDHLTIMALRGIPTMTEFTWDNDIHSGAKAIHTETGMKVTMLDEKSATSVLVWDKNARDTVVIDKMHLVLNHLV